MTDCRVIAAPGGNPAPLVALTWALLRQHGLRARALHLVLYQRAQHWLRTELIEGDHPLEQLRAVTDDPELAELHHHLARLPDQSPVGDDADPASALAFVETLWAVFREAQGAGDDPVVIALVGGTRRTLSVDSVVAFQLLARPQDLLVDVRIDPKAANDARARFYFPEQRTPDRVSLGDGLLVDPATIGVALVVVSVPRLRQLLPLEALGSFASALEAGEQAIHRGPVPEVEFDLPAKLLRVGAAVVKLSRDQAVWFAVLGVARFTRDQGWLDVNDVELIGRVSEVCRRRWHLEPKEFSDAWEFQHSHPSARLARLGPIRSRLRVNLGAALRGHPHRDEVIPEKRRIGGAAFERLRCAPSRLRLSPELEELCK